MSLREREVDALKRRLRRLTDRLRVQFDLGFAAAVRAVEAGATLERLKEMQCIPSAAPEVDTLPVEDPDTDVNIQLPENP